ncbi:MAG: J domain-containing protein [Bacteroidota bacterium]
MQYKDYYKVLGVSPSASEDEIKQVYKKLAVRYHPDKNPGDQRAEQKFKEISEAKEILLDADNRRKYDGLRNRMQAYQGAGRGRGGTVPPVDGEFGTIFSSFFEEVFGRNRGPKRGKDHKASIKISLEEAYHGINDVLTYEGKRLKVKLLPGIRNGQVLRMRGQGGPGKLGAPAGDLLLTIYHKPHPRFEAKESDLFVKLHVPLLAAVLGRKVQLESFKGTMKINIPAGTQSGKRLKLQGLGMPVYGKTGQFGDMYVSVKVEIPQKLSSQERQLFEQLEAIQATKQ